MVLDAECGSGTLVLVCSLLTIDVTFELSEPAQPFAMRVLSLITQTHVRSFESPASASWRSPTMAASTSSLSAMMRRR